MAEKLALKRLTASDLTFFSWHFRNHNAGNQKAINLNADVFVGKLYRAIEDVARRSQNKLGIDLWISGPGAAPPHNLQRKIIKGAAYKNWRLDGEFVHNPDEDPERFNLLAPGDIALFSFEGDLAPSTVNLLLVAKSAPEDEPLFAVLDEVLDRRGMAAVGDSLLRSLCEDIPAAHPLWLLFSDEDLEEAALGQAPAVTRLLSRPRPRLASLEELRKARRSAEETGQLGESLVALHLEYCRSTGEVAEYEWTSEVNAISPFDFRLRRSDTWEKLEVKTTTADFAREYHLPLSELRESVYGDGIFRIARVYKATPEHARMRVSQPFRFFGESILRALSELPEGVAPNGVTIVPAEEMFGEEILLPGPSDVEE